MMPQGRRARPHGGALPGAGLPAQGRSPHATAAGSAATRSSRAEGKASRRVADLFPCRALPIEPSTASNWAHDTVAEAIPGFQLRRVRSGVETPLAANGVSREIRGHLQSHGLAGTQYRHYGGHDYLPEKRRALEVLFEAGEPAKGRSRRA